MKTFFLVLACSSLVSVANSQYQWSAPAAIIIGSGNDVHPFLANSPGWLFNNEEHLAFSRNGKDIWIATTQQRGTSWEPPFRVTNDSADNDFPSLTFARFGSYTELDMMLVWQFRQNGNHDIRWSRKTQQGWSQPTALTTDQTDDITPHVAQRDGAYGVVWEREGRIMFAEYTGGSWSAIEQVTPSEDSLNSRPNVSYGGFAPQPVVVWERRKSDTTSAVMYSVRSGQSWSPPETLSFVGDNRTPRFFKATPSYYLMTVGWSAGSIIPSGEWRVWARSAIWSTSLSWDDKQFLPLLSYENPNQSVNGFMIITDAMTSWFAVAAGEYRDAFQPDSIAVAVAFQLEPTRLGVASSDSMRNPDVSAGVSQLSDGVRFWVIWQRFTSGQSELWGSNVLIPVGDVGEYDSFPPRLTLSQNYPNPFNPLTTIAYVLPMDGYVSLKVYDLLGRETITLVDEVKKAGRYDVRFDAGGFSSGVYFYRLHAGKSVQTKKLLLLR